MNKATGRRNSFRKYSHNFQFHQILLGLLYQGGEAGHVARMGKMKGF
jgi:hypothetical protein